MKRSIKPSSQAAIAPWKPSDSLITGRCSIPTACLCKAFQELQLLQRHRAHQVSRTALNGAERITSAASEPKATKAAPRAELP
jgi:hypothetical protein